MVIINSETHTCCGVRIMAIGTYNTKSVTVDVLQEKPMVFNLLVGINAIRVLGDIQIIQSGIGFFVAMYHLGL